MKTRSNRQMPGIDLLFKITLVLLCLPPAALAGQENGAGRMLFKRTDSNPTESGQAAPSESEDILSRSTILVDWGVLQELQEHGGGLLGLDAGDHGALTADVTRVTANSGGGYSLSGSLAGYPESRFVATVHGGALVASVSSGNEAGGNFEIIVNRAGQQEFREVEVSTMPRCGVSLAPASVAGFKRDQSASGDNRSAEEAEVPENAEETTVIDVMVVYTAGARQVAGGTNAMIASIHQAVENANLTFIASGVSALYRLVHTHEVNYDEFYGWAISTTLSHVINRNDGYMDEVHGLRDTYGADIVSLWIGVDFGGWANKMNYVSPDFEWAGFNVCSASYTATLFKLNYLFAHECGHILGCDHDLDNLSGPELYPYSFGWRWSGNDGLQYRSIMSYAPGSIVHQFSNPDILHMGVPTGTDTANNALTINNTKETVAGFRNSVSTLPVLHLSPVLGNVSSRGGSYSFRVVASGDWTWTKSPESSWVSVSEGSSQSGSQVFHYSVGSNPGGSRTASITIRSGGSAVVHQISQPGSSKKIALQKKLKKLKTQLSEAKRRNEASTVKRLISKIRKLTSQLRRL